MDLDMVLGSSPDPDITLDLGVKETAHINLLFPAFTSSVLTLSIANEAFCFSFFQFLHHFGTFPHGILFVACGCLFPA